MKKHNMLTIGVLLLLFAAIVPASAQVVNDDNEDGVVKLNASQSRYECVPGQVLLKFKDSQQQRKVRRVPNGYAVDGVDQLNTLLTKYGVNKMEQLLPNEKPNRQMRRTKAYNGDIIQERDLSQLYCLTLSEDHVYEIMQMIEELEAIPEIEYAEPNYLLHTLANKICEDYSDNPFVLQQWYLDDYGVKALWNEPIINPKRPVIAIIDTGVDMTHPDLVDNLWTNTAEAEGEAGYDNDNNGFAGDVHGWDFVNDTANVRDNNMHGTHVAGIAAAANNGIGIVGANPQAFIMPVTVMQSDGSGDVATIVRGINYAVQNGADILNLSLGTYVNSRALRQALENAYQSTVIVAAAGNDGIPISQNCGIPYAPSFPAAYSFVLGVMATSEDGLADFTNYDCDGPNYSLTSSMNDPDGFNYELYAPGTNILSTIPGGKYKVLQGTSMAAPLVAGAISALKMVKQYDTQEILWGDLTHTTNISEAFNLTERPADLELVKVQLRERKELTDETEEDYGGDGEIDAGETVDIYPVLRTTWGAASNIQMHLDVGENEDSDVVHILSETVDFGSDLSSYGKGVSVNPLQLQVPNDIADGRHIRLKLVVACDETEDVFEKEFVLIVTNMVKISGLITEDRTLTADHIYYVNENLAIPEGVTLTIEPGTRMEFAEGMGLSSNGKLVANGTPEKPIVFTGHKGALWTGILSHASTGIHEHYDAYTNEEQTLFTLLPTAQTPISFWDHSNFNKVFYTRDGENKKFDSQQYTGWDAIDMTTQQNLLTDPDFLTPAILKMKADLEAYANQFPSSPTEQESILTSASCEFHFTWFICDNPRDTISYCRIEGSALNESYDILFPYMKDCVFSRGYGYNMSTLFDQMDGVRTTLTEVYVENRVLPLYADNDFLSYSSIVNNTFGTGYYALDDIINYSKIVNNNYFNNCYTSYKDLGKYSGRIYSLGISASTPCIDKSSQPSYLGTSREDIIRPYIYEIGNAPSFGQVDLSNMPDHPYTEAHGIVWKVVVNGKDTQDEFEDLAPLGVGSHKFEVYFNRPMNKAVTPQISFGVRDPYTQNVVDEDGSWNEEGTIFTAYKTISGKTKSDGLNRIYVQGAEDNEFFPCPYEKTRFNIIINAAGSMATGFAAEAKMGRVNLTWNNDKNNFEDAMGFNIYRYSDEERLLPVYDEGGNEIWEDDGNGNWVRREEMQTVRDTICLNTEILDIETTEFTDYDVIPRQTYYYYYKVLSTDLQEYDVSNVVAATPLTSELGDANGNGFVDVADVITTVNYAAGMEPKPFIFEAADMNTDNMIDILDVIGIIQFIIQQSGNASTAFVEATATYTIEDGVLYVESPVALAGVQAQLNVEGQQDITVAEDLDGFEHTSAWLSDNDYLFLAYNMNGKTLSAGKHPLLYIGDADLSNLRLSDAQGHNVMIEAGQGTPSFVDTMGSKVLKQGGVFNLKGQKVAGKDMDMKTLPKGVYIINGEKVVK